MGPRRSQPKSPAAATTTTRRSPRLGLIQTKITDIAIEKKRNIPTNQKEKPGPPATANRSKRQSSSLSGSSVEEIKATTSTSRASSSSTIRGVHTTTAPPLRNKLELLRTLVEFDLNSEYGPSRGITRFERIDRALKFNLCSKRLVLEELVAELKRLVRDDPLAELCIWDHPTMYASASAAASPTKTTN